MQYKSILTPNFSTFCVEMQEAFEEGFKLDFDNLPHASFTYYECVLIRDDVVQDAVIDDVIKSVIPDNVFPVQAAVKRVGRAVGKGV